MLDNDNENKYTKYVPNVKDTKLMVRKIRD